MFFYGITETLTSLNLLSHEIVHTKLIVTIIDIRFLVPMVNIFVMKRFEMNKINVDYFPTYRHFTNILDR